MAAKEWSREFEDIWTSSDELVLVNALADRLPFLSDSEKEEALHRIAQFMGPFGRLEAFKDLIPGLREEARPTAVNVARDLSDPALLAVVASVMPPEQRDELVLEAWSLIRDLSGEIDQARALGPIVPLLPDSLKGPARKLAQGFSDAFLKPEALAHLAPFLDERQKADVLLEALEATRGIGEAKTRVYLLSLIAKQMPEPTRQEVVREALKAAAEIEVGDAFRADSMIDLAELVSEEEQEGLYRDALGSMRAVKEDRAEVLIRLAPRIPARMRPDLEAIAKEIEDPTDRAGTLLRLSALFNQADEAFGRQQKEALSRGPEDDQQAPEEGLEESSATEPAQKSTASEPPPPEPPKPPPPEPPKPPPPPPPDLDVAVSIHDDTPARLDELNRIPFANVLATTMQEVWEGRSKEADGTKHETPGDAFIIHIHGPWGSGKSSVLNFLRKSLRKGITLPGEDKPKEPWIVVWFNAWRHQRTSPPWWVLIEAIYRQGWSQIARKDRLALFLRRQLWLFRTGKAPYIFAFAILLLLASLGAGVLDSSGAVTNQHSYRTGAGSAEGTGVAAFLSGLNLQSLNAWLGIFAGLFALWGLLQGGLRALMFGSASTAARFMELSRDPMRPIVKHFHHLIAAFKQPVAIFIDDLDRCDKDYVLELLRGLQTLFHEANVTYVVAADREWIRASYESNYEDFSDNVREPGRPLGFLFLDKLFQVSVCIPRLSPERQKEYLQTLVRREAGSDGRDQETAEREAEAEAERALGADHGHNRMLDRIDRETDLRRKRALRAAVARRLVTAKASASTEHVLQEFAPMLEANPRAMKRLVNAYGFNKAVSLLAGQNLDVGPLARWTIIEMRWPLLARYLEQNAEQADEIGIKEAPEHLNDELASLYQDDGIATIIRGPTPSGAAVLSSDSLKQIFGTNAAG